jgi:DNA-binding MarR family transcriptional regulator
MEYFILALIDKAELSSLYEFQQRAGLQPGGIGPALRRLEEVGFVQRAESATRRRRELSLTPIGSRFLHDSFLQCLREYPDVESVLRATCVALLMGRPEMAAQYLEGLAVGRRNSAEEKSMDAERLGKSQRDSLSTYAWMRALCEARRRGAESDALSTLGRSLREKHQPDVVRQM